jgi:hypothetical protein
MMVAYCDVFHQKMEILFKNNNSSNYKTWQIKVLIWPNFLDTKALRQLLHNELLRGACSRFIDINTCKKKVKPSSLRLAEKLNSHALTGHWMWKSVRVSTTIAKVHSKCMYIISTFLWSEMPGKLNGIEFLGLDTMIFKHPYMLS